MQKENKNKLNRWGHANVNANYCSKTYIVCFRIMPNKTPLISPFCFLPKTPLKLERRRRRRKSMKALVALDILELIPLQCRWVCCFGFNGSLRISVYIGPSLRDREKERIG